MKILKAVHASNVSKIIPVTFPHFIQYLTLVEPASFDGHWKLYNDLCAPCTVRYDYISKLETMQSDLPALLHHLKKKTGPSKSSPEIAELPVLNWSGDEGKDPLYKMYYSNIDQEMLGKILEIYSIDFVLFD